MRILTSDLAPEVVRAVAAAFSPFVRSTGKAPHETLEILTSRGPLMKKAASDLEPLIRESLKVPLGKFPFPADPEKQLGNALQCVRAFYRDPRFRLFFRAGERPEEIVVYPLSGGCLLRCRQSARSALFLETGWFRRPRAASICEAIHVSAAMALPLVEAVMLHGVGIRKGETGHLFLGLPDSGKTTVSRFSLPEEVVSDDGIIVQRDGAGFYLVRATIDQASPSRDDRKISMSERTKISMGFLLEKDSRVYLERLVPSEVSSIILKNHIHYFRYFGSDSVGKTFSLISDLCRQIPFYRLHFTRDPSFWASIESEMAGIPPG